jgi:predicted dithiol-disulfide oxidoreductase (DUF899 family)
VTTRPRGGSDSAAVALHGSSFRGSQRPAADEVFQTYEAKWRGIKAMLPTLLDLTAYGRHETWEDTPAGWPQDKAGRGVRRDGRPIAQWTRSDTAVK